VSATERVERKGNVSRAPPSALPEMHNGVLYKCFCDVWNLRDVSGDELWDMFVVRWEALSEERLDKELETFMIRDLIDQITTTVQLGAFNQDGEAIGSLRIHFARASLVGNLPGVQISRVGVLRSARGLGIGQQMMHKAMTIARDMSREEGVNLIWLSGRVLDSWDTHLVLRFYEQFGFQKTNRYIETSGLLNNIMVTTRQDTPLEYLQSLGFQVEERREDGPLGPVLHILADPLDRRSVTITSADAAAVTLSASGTEIRELLTTTALGQGRMSLAMETLKPGQYTTLHWHDHLEEIYYILKGQGGLKIGDEARKVKAGDAILIPIRHVHCLHNTGDDDLVLLCAVSPPWYPEDYHPVEEDKK
jgi:mannose-6-phosphate isomerase-like protein (cupin superfamily)/GNAT superfamily N-acetyltransferase